MGIKIIFRNQCSPNQFRNLVTEIPNLVSVSSALLCSGFFQHGRGGYFAKDENNFCYNLHKKGISITTIGVHNNSWKNEYFRFVNELKIQGVNIRGLYKKRFHWHAKILLYKHNNEFVCGIIGSSNMTRNAFSLSSPFNYESDVVLFNPNKLPSNIINNLLTNDNKNSPFSHIDGIYNNENNYNISIIDRLKNIEEMVLNENWEYEEI